LGGWIGEVVSIAPKMSSSAGDGRQEDDMAVRKVIITNEENLKYLLQDSFAHGPLECYG
jgi:hypothetical protein